MSRPENSERQALVEHERSKERVGQKIGRAIEAFWADCVTSHPVLSEFVLASLDEYVQTQVGPIAPGSTSRILRDLRQKGRINYEVVNRAKSLYRALPLDTTTENTK